ncbi:alpha/beta hydrolase [Bacillus sp. DX1.1]|uniref:alpha/beta fold hydrolase n=1 Tax=unclassified Bacillus (in: firmicutes) TaxID=185979 RepID=UPI00256FAF31|nr:MULTISPECIES: alpha/beta hydrolase [unclassified Bacillus (in: firmicutes)]MDM5154292.1 alpha/beta hydrolase [Bacillus sp. DX1.1]WJE83207.1 alpha/beta hydrolase [Bacillus sp. DX3.1]
MNEITKTKVSQKLDIGGTKLYYEHFGENNENPTFVFDSGYGWTLNNWEPIKGEVSKLTKMFIYDRAGIGESENDKKPRHSQQAVENLRTLLQKANVKPPYVLVGHSFGGLNVRLYASTYPEEIAGVILLDSCHEDQNKIMAPLFSKEVREAYFSQFVAEGSLSEIEESLEQARVAKSLGNIPLIVMTGGLQPHHTPESMSAWISFHKNLAKLSTNSKHIIVEDAGHAIHMDRPQTVINAIKDMLVMIKA